MKLAEYARDAASLSIDGVNLKAVWRPDHCALALLVRRSRCAASADGAARCSALTPPRPCAATQTSAGRVLLLELVGAPGGAPRAGLPASVSAQLPRACTLRLLGELPLGLAEAEVVRDIAAAPDFLLAGTDRGTVAQVTWEGRLRGRCDLGAQPSERSVFARRSLSAATFLVLASDGDEAATCDGDSTPGRGWTPAVSTSHTTPTAGVASLSLCLPLRLLAVVYDNGAAVVLSGVDADGGFAADALSVDAWLAHAGAVAVALAPASRMAAVGTAGGGVALHALAEGCRPLRTLSLADWGYSPGDTGAARQLAWAPDGRALAVGYARRGAAVWSSSGCRLVHAMRPGGGGGAPLPAPPNSSRWSVAPARGAPTSPAAEVLDGGVAALAWSGCGHALLLGGGAHAACLVELALAKPLPQRRCCLATWAGAQLLQASDALLVVEAGDGHDGGDGGAGGHAGAGHAHGGAPAPEPRGVAQLRLPRAYLADNWPLTHAAVSEDGLHVAAAGRRGLALRSLRSDKWRVFGDVAQERSVAAAALLWLGPAVVVVNHAAAITGAAAAAGSGGFDASPAGAPASVRPTPALAPRGGAAYELLIFPRARLDAAALLARLPLAAAPLAVDALGADYLMIATAPLCITVYAADWRAASTPGGAATLTLTAVREVRVASPRAAPVALVLAPPSRTPPPHAGSRAALPAAHAASPAAAAVLHADGELAVLDLKTGRERPVAFDVDDFWLPVPPPPGASGEPGDAALAALAPPGGAGAPWWVYGHGGMRLLQPDDVAACGAGGDDDAAFAESADPELVFDRESYPLGLAPGPGAVVWLTQRLAAAGGGDLPCFEAAPKAQPVLPCLLRHLLRRGADADAATLARSAEGKPHFTHSLEWLLFSALDAHVSRRGSSAALHIATPAPARSGGPDALQTPHIAASSVLARAVALIAAFPEFADVVVSVARKTDEKEWRALFAATGSPSALFEACLAAGRLRTAACFLLIIDKLEGAAAGQDAALRLLQASMDGGVEYPLAGELVRFLVRSGREYALAEEAASAEETSPQQQQQSAPSGRGWLSGLSALAFGSGASAAGRPPRAAAAAAQMRAQALHSRVAGVLAAHARQLLAARELPRLAALARGTLFSLPDFFAAERGGPAARLGDFAKALNALREAVGSLDEPGAREDCELVLAALQRAGLLDWTVVVATLLQRRSLLRTAFAREPELWRVWAAAMRSPALRDEDGTLAALLATLEADLAQTRG